MQHEDSMAAVFARNLIGGTPPVDVAKKELVYPLYGADFDPLNHHFLLVGGGGGSSSTGIPNRISLLDTSRRSEIREIADIELAHDEDSVVSLAVAHSDPSALIAYAGINSSVKDQEAGRNEHFRSFKVPLPARRKKNPDDPAPPAATVAPTQALARSAIFRSPTGPKNECYQRTLRLSPPLIEQSTPIPGSEKEGKPTRILKKRLATIASGLATKNEVVTFPVTEKSSAPQVISRINLGSSEATDADLINVDDVGSSYVLAYSTDTELYLQQLSDGKGTVNSDPISVYQTTKGPVGRSKIRALRFLTARYILLLQNRPNRSGVELVVLKLSKDFAQSQQMLVKYLKAMKQAVGLDICALSKGEDASQQFVVAVAGQDSSLQIFTLDWLAGEGLTQFRSFADIENLHRGPITRITFSYFVPPTWPVTGQTPPQYIRLASVGVDKSVLVQTLPLEPSPSTGTGNKQPRYVLTKPSQFQAMFWRILMSINLLVLCIAIVISFLEFRGAIPPTIGVNRFVPQRWQEKYGNPYPYAHGPPGPVIPQSMPDVESLIDKIKLSEASAIIKKLEAMQSSIPSVQDVRDTLVDLVSRKEEEEHLSKAVIIRDLEHLGGEISAELKREAEVVREGTLKKWESLTKKEQKTWKQKLKAAGHWTEQQGEAVLKGVFFGQLAGVVAGAVGG